MARNPFVEEMNRDLIEKYGILLRICDMMDLLKLGRTQTYDWIRRNGLTDAGRKATYYSKEVARALVANGGVIR